MNVRGGLCGAGGAWWLALALVVLSGCYGGTPQLTGGDGDGDRTPRTGSGGADGDGDDGRTGDGDDGNPGDGDGPGAPIACVQALTPELPDACAGCACRFDPAAVADCDADCLALILCVGRYCGLGPVDAGCVLSNCMDEFSAAPNAGPAQKLGDVLTMPCGPLCDGLLPD